MQTTQPLFFGGGVGGVVFGLTHLHFYLYEDPPNSDQNLKILC